MTVEFTKNFIKQSKKLSPKLRAQLFQRVKLFTKDPYNTLLRDHQLKGKFKRYRSIDITGDYRALYIPKNGKAIFDIVGTHSQLYG